MAAVAELLPGDLVTTGAGPAVFLTRVVHPLWPTLMLVVWHLGDGSWSFDALDLRQDVGEVTPSTQRDRRHRLAELLTGEGATP